MAPMVKANIARKLGCRKSKNLHLPESKGSPNKYDHRNPFL